MDTDTNDCKEKFEDLLKAKCEAIGSCTYDSVDGDCVETHDCSDGNDKDASTCSNIHPVNFHTNKCELSGTKCEIKEKLCADYNKYGITGDNCTVLVPTNKNDQRCILQSDSSCKEHYDDCRKIRTNDNNECSWNVPNTPSDKCVWQGGECKPEKRYCGESRKSNDNIEICPSLPIAEGIDSDKKKCIYKSGSCVAKYVKCEHISVSSESDCEHNMPLNANNDDYDYTQYCTKDTSISQTSGAICKAVNRKCDEYYKNSYIRIPTGLRSEELCEQLEVTENYQRCAYDEVKNICYEEYKTCEDYITNKVETDRTGCEKIVLKDKTKKCVYIPEKDECQTRNIYTNCREYTGNDKKICESIVLYPNNRSYCILDKDKECIEKSINCSEAETEEDCLNIAKASASNKRCAYKSKCYEEYIRCEDYVDDPQTSCSSIKLYDGKKCKLESVSSIGGGSTSICRSNYKTCGQTNRKEECKLIAITGVSDPERKVCDYVEISSSKICFENYKYCSDYRGTNSSTCTYIKPYDESTNNIDISYKCIYESDIGCHRVPVECGDAHNNPILCEEFSQYIKDKDKKYCLFTGGQCISQYQKCEYFDKDVSQTTCESNIVKGNLNICKYSGGKCVTDNECNLFTNPYTAISPSSILSYYKELCESIDPNCTFYSNGSCLFEEKTCNGIKFYSDDENNKQICENMEVSDPYRKCTLKEDKTGCTIVYRELNYSTTFNSYTSNISNSNQENSSNIISKSISLVIILLSLFI